MRVRARRRFPSGMIGEPVLENVHHTRNGTVESRQRQFGVDVFKYSTPFDRLLVSQAQLEGLILVINDAFIRKYNVQTLWWQVVPKPLGVFQNSRFTTHARPS